MRRLVLDADVALDELLFDDPRCEARRMSNARRGYRPVTNDVCRDGWQRVRRYPALQLDATRLAALETEFNLLRVVVIETRGLVLMRCRDADDQKFPELACGAGARVLLTRYAELLRLSRRTKRAPEFVAAKPDSLGSILVC